MKFLLLDIEYIFQKNINTSDPTGRCISSIKKSLEEGSYTHCLAILGRLDSSSLTIKQINNISVIINKLSSDGIKFLNIPSKDKVDVIHSIITKIEHKFNKLICITNSRELLSIVSDKVEIHSSSQAYNKEWLDKNLNGVSDINLYISLTSIIPKYKRDEIVSITKGREGLEFISDTKSNMPLCDNLGITSSQINHAYKRISNRKSFRIGLRLSELRV